MKSLFVFAVLLVLAVSIANAAQVEPSTWGSIKALFKDGTTEAQNGQNQPLMLGAAGPGWGNQIVSEAFYALDVYRTGTSHAVYNGLFFGDWRYIQSDQGALNKIVAWIGAGNVGILGADSHGFERGGYCRFFVNLVLYRSSYGYPLGHLGLIRSGYPAINHDVSAAGTGWVVYSTLPHWMIVVANLGWGLDVIDSNFKHPSWWTSSSLPMDYGFYICRHTFTWGQLSGYRAYCPWEDPVIIR